MGIILYTLLCGGLPFDDDDEDEMKQLIIKGEYEEPSWLSDGQSLGSRRPHLASFVLLKARISLEPLSLIRSLLSADPASRPCVKDILAHPWFTKSIYPACFSGLPSPMTQSPPNVIKAFDTAPSSFFASGSSDADKDALLLPMSTPTSPQRQPASSHPAVATSGSEVSDTSFEFRDGEQSSASGLTTPTTVESGDAGGETAATSSTAMGGGGGSSGNEANTLRRAGSESTLTKTAFHIGTRTGGVSKIDLGEDLAEEEEDHLENLEEMYPPHLPLAQNSRTPSRTKRRSISSTLSERLHPSASTQHLFNLGSQPTPFPTVDYLTLLTEHRASRFSTPDEQELVKGLERLGFDTGQLMHSVSSDACDTSGALWWILKSKMTSERTEHIEREQAEEEALKRRTAEAAAALPEKREAEEKQEDARRQLRSTSPACLPLPLARTATSSTTPLESPMLPTSKKEPVVELSMAVDDPFGNPTVVAGPISVKPPNPLSAGFEDPSSSLQTFSDESKLHSPSFFPTSRSFPNHLDETASGSGSFSLPHDGLRSVSPVDHILITSTSPPSSPGKSRRADMGKTRSSSVSMLQTLAAGLTRKKSDERGFREEVERLDPKPIALPQQAHSKLQKPPPSSPASRPSVSSSSATSSSTTPKAEPNRLASPARRATHPMDEHRTSETSSLPTIHSVDSGGSSFSSIGRAKPQSKPTSSLLSTFRQWFREDLRKQRGKRPAHMPSAPVHSSSSGSHGGGGHHKSGSISRSTPRHSLEQRIPKYPIAARRGPATELGRPSMTRQSSSQQSIHSRQSAHSRRSSIASVHLPAIDASLSGAPGGSDPFWASHLNRMPSDPGRRRSLESRTPTGEGSRRSHSRPSSVRSFNLGQAHGSGIERHLSRSPTASSAGSIRRSAVASPLQHYHRRVGSTSSTKVVRQIKTHSSGGAHMRSPSAGSSVRSFSSTPHSTSDVNLSSRADAVLTDADAAQLESLDEGIETLSEHQGTPTSRPGSPSRPPSACSSRHSNTVLVAHRTKTVLASPYHARGPPRMHLTSSDITPRVKPVLRDVFALKPVDGDDPDWVDEDEGFEGGLGQGGTKRRHHGHHGGHGRSSSFSSMTSFTVGGGGGGGSRGMTSPSAALKIAPASRYPLSSFGSSAFSSSAPSSLTVGIGLLGNVRLPSPILNTSASTFSSSQPETTVSLNEALPESAGGPSTTATAKVLGSARRQGLPAPAFRSADIVEEEEEEEDVSLSTTQGD